MITCANAISAMNDLNIYKKITILLVFIFLAGCSHNQLALDNCRQSNASVVDGILTAPPSKVDKNACTIIETEHYRVYSVTPVYPSRASKHGKEGNVDLEFTVSPNGAVNNVKIISSTPPNLFNESALKAINLWHFEAKSERAKSSNIRIRQELRFRLTPSKSL